MNVDDFIASQFPVLPVPADGAVKAAGHGVRYHAARNGLWREINLPWMRSLMPVATCDGIQVPYGLPTASVELALPVPDKSLWRDFVLQAKAAMPNECAAIIAWNTATQQWRLAPRRAIKANPSFIEYEEPSLDENEIKVVDLHSHALHPAYFSSTDDTDDRGSIKLSVVFGNIDGEVTMEARLMLIDRAVKVSIDGTTWGAQP